MQKGFTIIEAMIVLAITGIIASVAVPAFQAHKAGRPVEYGVVCKSGYKFTSTGYRNSGLVQIIDEQGHGIPCDR